MKTVILRTHKRTKSNSFSDALFRIYWFSKLTTVSYGPVTINYVNK
jgi:hypothetical protein